MDGKKNILRLSAFLLVLTMVVPVPVFALFGVGDIVSDPGSYSYYVEQIKKATEQLNQLEEQVETLGGIQTTADQISRDVRGSYNRGASLVYRVKRLKKILDAKPSTLQGQALKWINLAQDGLDIGGDGFVSAHQILDANFKDPRLAHRNYEIMRDLDKRYQTRQWSLKNSITKSDELLRQMPDRLKEIEDLTEQIDQTVNLKDAQDLTNRFLAEILTILTEQLALASHIAESQAVLNYQGVTEDVIEQREKRLSEVQNNLKQTNALEDRLAERGFDPKTASTEDFRKLMQVQGR